MIATILLKLLATVILSLNLCHSDCGKVEEPSVSIGTALSCYNYNGTVVCNES